jgi:tRNA uridine 5-carbamoylmethylation protein Kti12
MISHNFLLILVGLPSSGKSTFSRYLRKFLKDITDLTVEIIDPDIIRKKLFPYEFDFENEAEVRHKNYQLIESALAKNNIVISDDLNYYTSMRQELKQIAERLEVDYFIIHISTPLEICLKWNEARGLKIPDQVIRNVFKKIDDFEKYSWNKSFATIDLSKTENLEDTINLLINSIENRLNKNNIQKSNQKSESNYDREYHEELDKLTRSIVGNFLKKRKLQQQKKQILRLRKEFIKKSLNITLEKARISEEFNKFLQDHLELEKT